MFTAYQNFKKEEPNNTLTAKESDTLAFLDDFDDVEIEWDVNGTVIFEDIAGGETREQFLTKIIARRKAEGRSLTDDQIKKINEILEENFIFPSFFKVLENCMAAKKNYKFKIRTFGHDIPEIEKAIKKRYPNLKFSLLNFTQKDEQGIAPDAQKQRALLAEQEKTDVQCVLVQENYEYWKKHEKTLKTGKQTSLTTKPRTLKVFIDDCGLRKDIIHFTDNEGNTIGKQTAVIQGYLIVADTADAVLDENCYIKGLAEAAQRQKKFLDPEPRPGKVFKVF